MNFEILATIYGYYIALSGYGFNDSMEYEYLGLMGFEYQQILRRNGAYVNGCDCYFRKKEDAEKAIKVLEPYLIMAILVGENNGD